MKSDLRSINNNKNVDKAFAYLQSTIIIGAIIIPSQQCWRGYSNAVVRGWLGELVSACVGG